MKHETTKLPKEVLFKPQKLGYFSNALVIHIVDAPIYYLECISERHFIIAGGGGPSKTGVHNQINILELVPIGDSCTAELKMKYLTPPEIPEAIMNGSLMKDLPIVKTRLITDGNYPTIYDITFNPQKRTFAITDYGIAKDDRFKSGIKSVKYASGRMYTGSEDGQLLAWDVSSKHNDIKHQVRAHSKMIDEIDVNVVDQQVVTLSRSENKCVIWDSNNLKMVNEIKKDFINQTTDSSVKYGFRSCKYAHDTSSDSKNPREAFLMIVCNPIGTNGSGCSKIYKISPRNLKIITVARISCDGIQAMTVSSDGKYVALGTASGAVSILNVKRMKRIYNIEGAHSMNVTGLAFLDPKPESLNLTNSETCALISTSIDKKIVLHRPRKRSLTTGLVRVIIMAIMIYLFYSLVQKYFAQKL